jgi:hypothetical protein
MPPSTKERGGFAPPSPSCLYGSSIENTSAKGIIPCPHRRSSKEIKFAFQNLNRLLPISNIDHDVTTIPIRKRSTASSPEDIVQQSKLTTTMTKRRSTRQAKERSIPMITTRVRYDMELVPAAKRNSIFWDSIQTWPLKKPALMVQEQIRQETIQNKELKTSISDDDDTPCDKNDSTYAIKSDVVAHNENAETTRIDDESCKLSPSHPPSFCDSILWIPGCRKDWDDSISELTAICTSAAYRRHDALQKTPFHPPLSREYIKDRINIDDPIRGYQIRHSTGGWLQGFLLWTNFTTWTHYFTWDSLHPLCGMTSTVHAKDDGNGSLAKELQAQPRHGDPNAEGIVFDHVAEISLLGGLGCGELLLRMALDEIRNSPERYQYVVLQATEGSRAFYEKFGFVRVGAVCRYGTTNSSTSQRMKQPPGTLHFPNLDTPEQGYRHWTHANESQKSLNLHGGPSYMMCLKLPLLDDKSVPNGNLMAVMKQKYQVFEKPMIQPLGVTITTASKCRNATMISTRLSGVTNNADNKTTVVNNKPSTLRKSVHRKQPKFIVDSGMSRNDCVESDAFVVAPSRKRHKTSRDDFPLSDPLQLRRRDDLSAGTRQDDQVSTPPIVTTSYSNNNLRITVYPQKWMPSSSASSSTAGIPAVTPTDCGKQTDYYSSMDNNPPTTSSVSSASPERGTVVVTTTAALVKHVHGTTTWASGKNKTNSSTSRNSLKKVKTKLTMNSNFDASEKKKNNKNKKIGRPPKRCTKKGDDGSSNTSQLVGNKSPQQLELLSMMSSVPLQIQASEYLARTTTPTTMSTPPSSVVGTTIFSIDKAVLCKQKVKSYPRDRLHFFNKVVRRTASSSTSFAAATNTSNHEYFFVLHYQEDPSLSSPTTTTPTSLSSSSSSSSARVILIPMIVKGILAGKRSGRPRYQCVVLNDTSNWITDSVNNNYEAVNAVMVMKTPFVAQEAWDIECIE